MMKSRTSEGNACQDSPRHFRIPPNGHRGSLCASFGAHLKTSNFRPTESFVLKLIENS